MMIRLVIYHCYGGAHSSVTSAGIYLGLLPRHRLPATAEILGVPHYDGNEPITHGHFRFMGRDLSNRPVFVMGKRLLGPPVNRMLAVLAGIYGHAGSIFTVDTTAYVNLLMIFGGYTSRSLKLAGVGRPIVVLGTKMAYFNFVRLAELTEKKLKQNTGLVTGKTPGVGIAAVFYICTESYRLPMLAAALHVHPQASERELLRWSKRQAFAGAVGSVLYVGAADNHQVYVVGASNEPVLIARIMREFRSLLGITQSRFIIAEPRIPATAFNCLAARACRKTGMTGIFRYREQQQLQRSMNECRRASEDVKIRIKEGILD